MPRRVASPVPDDSPAAKPRARRRTLAPARRPSRKLKWLLPAILGLLAFGAGIALDTAALLRLFWAGATGHFGLLGRAVALLVALTCAAPLIARAARRLTSPARP
jgi:hypothetical protein